MKTRCPICQRLQDYVLVPRKQWREIEKRLGPRAMREIFADAIAKLKAR